MKNRSSPIKKPIPFLFTLLCTAIMSLQSAHANTITVANTNDSGAGSLRQALADANDGDTINFSVSGTILLASTLPDINITLTIDATGQNITISGNNSVQVMRVNSGATLTLEDLTIVQGQSSTNGGGGAIRNQGTLTVTNSTLSNNLSDHFAGGAILNGGTLTVNNSTFSFNTTINGGGGIANEGTLTVTNSTFSGNAAGSVGGGIFNTGTLTVTNTTFSSNSTVNGGGICNSGTAGTVTVTNSTFSGNGGSGDGGGIYNVNGGTVTVTNSTFSGNGGSGDGGGIYNVGTLNLNTSIVGNSTGPDIFGTVSSGDYNLVENTSGATLSGTHNITGVDPMLGPLQDNGGPTFTHALLVGSPAINAGTDLTALNGTIDNMTTGVTVSDATGILAGVGFAIQIDSEQMIVDAKSANTLTVTRGANSTTPAAHSNGAAVNPAFDQRDLGFARKVGSAVDIGAFEVQSTAPVYAVQVQQPINADGTSVFNVRRGVVPVKFTLTLNGVATCNLPPATIAVTRTAGGVIGPIDESSYTGPADTGSNFRIDSCQYIYNLSASALGAGTYEVDIIINGQVVGSASFALR